MSNDYISMLEERMSQKTQEINNLKDQLQMEKMQHQQEMRTLEQEVKALRMDNRDLKQMNDSLVQKNDNLDRIISKQTIELETWNKARPQKEEQHKATRGELKRDMAQDKQRYKLLKILIVVVGFIVIACLGDTAFSNVMTFILLGIGLALTLFVVVGIPLLLIFRGTLVAFMKAKSDK